MPKHPTKLDKSRKYGYNNNKQQTALSQLSRKLDKSRKYGCCLEILSI